MRVRTQRRGAQPLGEERKAEVFTAAIAEVAARGLEAARLSEIARNARVSLPTLRRHFGGKDDLFRSAVRAIARTHVSRLCGTLPPGPGVAQLRNFCGRGWELLRTPIFAQLYRLTVADMQRFPDLVRFYAEEVYGPMYQTLARMIEQGIAEGAFRPLSAHCAARLIVSALVQQAFWCNHVDAFGPSLGAGCHRVVAETLSLVLGGLTAR